MTDKLLIHTDGQHVVKTIDLPSDWDSQDLLTPFKVDYPNAVTAYNPLTRQQHVFANYAEKQQLCLPIGTVQFNNG